MSLEAKEVEDARLVDKFMAEMKKMNSPLRIDYTNAMKLPEGEQQDAEVTRVLKKHGYEKLSPAKLQELFHERPQVVSHIKPPVLVDKEIATKPKFDWDLFAGVYQITSEAPASPIKEIMEIGSRDESISWTEDGVKKESKPTTMIEKQVASDGAVTWDYWVVWGDKESEWFSAQFFGVSATKKKPTFVGFRHIKGVEKPLPFNGVQIDKVSKDDAEFWLEFTAKATLGIILAGAIGYIAFKAWRWRTAYLEGIERQEKELVDKEVETMLSESDPKHERDLAEKMTEKIEALDLGERATDGKLTEAQRAQVDALMKAEMKQLVNEQYGAKSRDIQTRLSKQEGFAEKVIDTALMRFEKANAWNPQSAKFEGSVGHMVENNLFVRHVEAIAIEQKKKLDEVKEVAAEGKQINQKVYSILSHLRTMLDFADAEEHPDAVEKYEREVARLKAEHEIDVEKVHESLAKRSEKRFEAKELREKHEKAKEKAEKAKREARKAMEAVKPARRRPVPV